MRVCKTLRKTQKGKNPSKNTKRKTQKGKHKKENTKRKIN